MLLASLEEDEAVAGDGWRDRGREFSVVLGSKRWCLIGSSSNTRG